MVNRYVKRCSVSKWRLYGFFIAPMAASFVICVDHTPHLNQFAKIKEDVGTKTIQHICDEFSFPLWTR